MSATFKSHENLLSSRAMGRSEPILADTGSSNSRNSRNLCAAHRNRGCVCGTDRNASREYVDRNAVHNENQLLKNLIVMGIGHVLAFSAFTALQSLQSSLFLETGLGLRALCIVYGCAVVSGFYGSAFVSKFTPNWTMVLSVVIIGLFLSAFFYPRMYSIVPTSVALGLVFGPLFVAQTAFVMHLVARVSYLAEGVREKIQQRYLRLFFFFNNSARIWGHMVAALLVHYGGDIYVFFTTSQHHLMHGVNARFSMSDLNMSPSPYATIARPSLCALEKMSDDDVFRNPTSYVFILPLNLTLMLISVFLGMAFLGVAVVTTLLDKCELYAPPEGSKPIRSIQHIQKVATAFLDPQLWLVQVLSLFMGLEQGFINADFTRSYVSCALGLEPVTYTMMAMGTMNTLSALTIHMFSKHVKRVTMMVVGIVCQAGLLMVLWLWTPARDDTAVFYIIATGWGLCHAIWETVVTTHIATTYTDDWQAPFSSYFIAQWIGLTCAFGWSSLFVVEIKVYILVGSLAFAILVCILLELHNHRRRKEQERTVHL